MKKLAMVVCACALAASAAAYDTYSQINVKFSKYTSDSSTGNSSRYTVYAITQENMRKMLGNADNEYAFFEYINPIILHKTYEEAKAYVASYASVTPTANGTADGKYVFSQTLQNVQWEPDTYCTDAMAVVFYSYQGENAYLLMGYPSCGKNYNSWTYGFEDNYTYSHFDWQTLESSPTPEPASGLLTLIGLAGLALRRRRAG